MRTHQLSPSKAQASTGNRSSAFSKPSGRSSSLNARDAKAVPGRKTDGRDCEWLADLLRHGLRRAGFIPPLAIRELRELTRYRQTLIKEHTAVANRIQKLIESATIKRGQVATDVRGLSGRLMLHALAADEEHAERVVELARGSLKSKKPALPRALTSRLTPAQRLVLTELLARLAGLAAATARRSERSVREVAGSADPFGRTAVKLLEPIPGVGHRVAEVIGSEVGVDLTRFPTEGHLASWAGSCPGNNESAGNRRSGQTTTGRPYLRAAVTQAAGAASHTTNTGLAAPSHRLSRRMGNNKALVAVRHSLLVILSGPGRAGGLWRTRRRLLRPSATAVATRD
ncbi:MAG: IS110 family transposase [Acidobacteriota bacterium]|nr:IS110 family transposase [Acidobacteriota bacterium]